MTTRRNKEETVTARRNKEEIGTTRRNKEEIGHHTTYRSIEQRTHSDTKHEQLDDGVKGNRVNRKEASDRQIIQRNHSIVRDNIEPPRELNKVVFMRGREGI